MATTITNNIPNNYIVTGANTTPVTFENIYYPSNYYTVDTRSIDNTQYNPSNISTKIKKTQDISWALAEMINSL